MFRLLSFFSTSSSESCASKAVNTPTLTCLSLFGGGPPRDAVDVSEQNITAPCGGNKMDRMKLQVGFGRRGFLRSAAIAGAGFWADETLDAAVQNVNRSSSPSDLKITDLRVAVVKDAPFVCPLIRIDTNQEIYGLGEVRDGASKTYALFLKSRLLGENPCNIDKIFRKIKQFGGDSRQAGGVCGVEMALWDLAGKAYGVPVYQMLGGKFRDKIRCYADTTESHDPKVYGQRLKGRKEEGFTWLKMDLGIDLLHDTPGTLTHPLGLTERDVCN